MKKRTKHNTKVKIFTNDVFKFHIFAFEKVPKQGWKIHVSANFENVLQIYQKVKTFCYKNGINFKNVKTKKIYLNNFLSRGADRKNSAKFITIYPDNANHARVILKKLYPKLKTFKGPVVLTDRQYKKSILHFRYGDNKHIPFPQVKEEKLHIDKRIINQHKPSQIKDLFSNKPKEKQIMRIGDFFIKSVLHFSNYGGTYLAEKEGKTYIAKEARPYLGVSSINNPISLRLNEVKITLHLKYSQIIPKYYTTIKMNNYVYTFFEYIKGPSLSKLATKKFAVLFWKYLPTQTRKENEGLLLQVINSCIFFLKRASQLNLHINDIKADNFVWSVNGILCIDLDTASIVGKTKPVKVFHPLPFLNKKTNEAIENMKMGYMLASMISNFLSLRNLKWSPYKIVDFFWSFCVWYDVSPKIRDSIMDLMCFKNRNLLTRIKNKKRDVSQKLTKLSNDCILLSELKGTTWIHEIFENKIWDNEKNGYHWKSVYLEICQKKFKNAQENIDNIYKTYVKDTMGVKYLCIPGLHCSSYIFLGNAGLILLMLFFKKTFGSDYFKDKLLTLVDAMEPRYILKPNFLTGIIGIAYLALALYAENKKSKYLSIIQNHLVTLKYFQFKSNGSLLYKDSNNKKLSEKDTNKINSLLKCFID